MQTCLKRYPKRKKFEYYKFGFGWEGLRANKMEFWSYRNRGISRQLWISLLLRLLRSSASLQIPSWFSIYLNEVHTHEHFIWYIDLPLFATETALFTRKKIKRYHVKILDNGNLHLFPFIGIYPDRSAVESSWRMWEKALIISEERKRKKLWRIL